jgi:hypothetical protein
VRKCHLFWATLACSLFLLAAAWTTWLVESAGPVDALTRWGHWCVLAGVGFLYGACWQGLAALDAAEDYRGQLALLVEAAGGPDAAREGLRRAAESRLNAATRARLAQLMRPASAEHDTTGRAG